MWRQYCVAKQTVGALKKGTPLDSSAFKAVSWARRAMKVRRMGIVKPLLKPLVVATGLGGGATYAKYRFENALRHLDINAATSDQRLESLFREIDADNDGAVTPQALN